MLPLHSWGLTGVIAFLCSAGAGAEPTNAVPPAVPPKPALSPVRVVPINVAEAIFEPFFYPDLGGFRYWTVEPGPDHGLQAGQTWFYPTLSWTHRPASGPVARLWREFDLDCTGYDQFLACTVLPEGASLRVILNTDKGQVEKAFPPATLDRKEYSLPMDGAARHRRVTLELSVDRDAPGEAWPLWLGLANSELLKAEAARWERLRNQDFDVYLKPETFTPSFKPVYGIIDTAEEIERLRATDAYKGCTTAQFPPPGNEIREFASGGKSRSWFVLTRDREFGTDPCADVMRPARAGLVLKDTALLRLAAKRAVALATCEHWEPGIMSYLPGSAYELRAFLHTDIAPQVAAGLDLAGEVLSAAGKDLLNRRLMEEGLGWFNYIAMRYEYIHHCNQLAAFSMGRLAASAVVERTWPRLRPYTDLAVKELTDSLEDVTLPDGGYVEGPSYLDYTMSRGLTALLYYARGRNVPFASVVPKAVGRTGLYLNAVVSTDESRVSIPLGDAQSVDEPRLETASLLALAAPDSQWVTYYRQQLKRSGSTPPGFDSQIPAAGPDWLDFVSLPVLGIMASTRQFDGGTVKLLVVGGPKGPAHNHEDKGSFVLEFAGQTFAMDPGMGQYANPANNQLKTCQVHNMLLPTLASAGRPAPVNPLPADVKPQGQGNAVSFRATIDPTAAWPGWYRKWQRSWESSTPEDLIIRDEWELKKGTGVEFVWMTQLPVRQESTSVVITGRHGSATLTPEPGSEVRIEELPLREKERMTRLRFVWNGASGVGQVRVCLQATGK